MLRSLFYFFLSKDNLCLTADGRKEFKKQTVRVMVLYNCWRFARNSLTAVVDVVIVKFADKRESVILDMWQSLWFLYRFRNVSKPVSS